MSDFQRRLLRLVLGVRLPVWAGNIFVPGLEGPLSVRRDAYGIPHIEGSENDVWFGLGFCQAQDRAFQLELRLRLVRGTLSELFGREALVVDRLARRLGFRAASDRQWPEVDADVRQQIEAFVRGINAGNSKGLRRRPHEFVLLRSQPAPWEAADVLGVGKMMSFLLIGNWDVELARLQILRRDGPRALRDLDPAYVEAEERAGSLPGAVERLEADLTALTAVVGTGGGSNSWVVGGAWTASGRPIVANDPHLDASLPPHWYLAHLRTPEWAAAGATLVGAPAFALGHNGSAAWGITAGLVDTTDLFLEEVGPHGKSVREGDGYVPCQVRREVIRVKGENPVVEEVLETPRGPLIGPALEGEVGAISLNAVWLEPKPARGFLTAHKAQSWEEFRREFAAWPLLNQNLVYGDVNGNIAWQIVGEAPRRKNGSGTLPAAGWLAGAGWEADGVAFEEMPSSLNPAEEFLATANSRPVTDGPATYLGVDFLDSYRRDRIVEALADRRDWDMAATQRLQLDETSLAWREIRETVLAATALDRDAALALDLLGRWDGQVGADSAAATVFELFGGEMWRRVAHRRAPKAAEYALGRGFTPLLSITTFAAGRASRFYRNLREQPAGWFERSWQEEIGDALAAVVRDLKERFGADPKTWAWGRVRPLVLEHPIGRFRPLAPIFNRGPYPWGGDGNTISQASGSPLRPLGRPGVIASVRMVVEVGDWEGVRFALPGGQSGNPFSPHYDDQLPLWLRGEGVRIAWSAEAVRAATASELRLRPA